MSVDYEIVQYDYYIYIYSIPGIGQSLRVRPKTRWTDTDTRPGQFRRSGY